MKYLLFYIFILFSLFLSYYYNNLFFILLFFSIFIASLYFGPNNIQRIMPNIFKAILRKYLDFREDELNEVIYSISQKGGERKEDIDSMIKKRDLNYVLKIPIENDKSGFILNTLWHYQNVIDRNFIIKFGYWENNQDFFNCVDKLSHAGIVGRDLKTNQIFLTDVGYLYCLVNKDKIGNYKRFQFKSLDDRTNKIFTKTT